MMIVPDNLEPWNNDGIMNVRTRLNGRSKVAVRNQVRIGPQGPWNDHSDELSHRSRRLAVTLGADVSQMAFLTAIRRVCESLRLYMREIETTLVRLGSRDRERERVGRRRCDDNC